MAEPLHQELLQKLKDFGMIGYGESISGEFVRNVIGLTMPEVATRAQFAAISLKELAAVDFVRAELLKIGMYLARDGEDYRILTPSENLRQVDTYMRDAARKMNRARLLKEMTPARHAVHDNRSARIFMRQEAAAARPSAA